ncbi:MAG: DUF4157 domain-containing protein [Blastocatellia bacterium]
MRSYAQKSSPLQPKMLLEPAPRPLLSRREDAQGYASPEAARFDHEFSRVPVNPISSTGIQAKLAISTPGDRYEREADHIAERVMRLPEPQVQRACACGSDCPTCQTPPSGQEHKPLPIQRVEAGGQEPTGLPSLASSVLHSSGQPLDAATRNFMEPRFGQDFSQVRIHADADASRSAKELNAHAYTYGRNIVFAADKYQPASAGGRQLLSHELAHVVQQGGGSAPQHLQRQEDVPMAAVERDAPNAKSWKGASASCGPDFCTPLLSTGMAMDMRKDMWPIIMLGIGIAVSSRVLPLWSTWAFGGSSSIQDLSKTFGADFTASKTTAATTDFLLNALKAKLTASPPTVPAATGFLKLDITTLIPSEIKAIDDWTGANQMNFNVIGEIPGNIAGGIGKDQAANPVGATPSPQDDARIAKGSVTIFDTGTQLVVMPDISYTVKDTVDLCPGNCGSGKEQIATVPMSSWEATGISGDVPFTVDFPPPALLLFPFIIPKPAAPKSAPAKAPATTPAKPPATTPKAKAP